MKRQDLIREYCEKYRALDKQSTDALYDIVMANGGVIDFRNTNTDPCCIFIYDDFWGEAREVVCVRLEAVEEQHDVYMYSVGMDMDLDSITDADIKDVASVDSIKSGEVIITQSLHDIYELLIQL